jgi:hypothetical protein
VDDLNGLIIQKNGGSSERGLTAGAGVMHLGEAELLAPSENSTLARQIFELADRASDFAGANRAARAPLSFAAYKAAIQNRASILRALHQERQRGGAYIPDDSPELRRFVAELYDAACDTPDVGGYANYLGAVNDTLGEAVLELLRQSAGTRFRETETRMHTHIVGGAGSGKSELLKLLVHHYVKHPELGAVLILDPHRKMAREVARWREFADDPTRLVYLDAAIEDVNDAPMPGINPLALRPVADQVKADELKADVARQLADAVGLLRESDTMTGNMVTVASYCLRILLDVPGATLLDLRTMLRADKSHPFLQAAMRTPDPYHREFFEEGGGFFGESFQSAKQAVSKRLDDALFAPRLRRVLSAAEPLDLEAAVEARKVICVDVGSVGPHADNVFGRLMMAQVAALGQRRIADRTAPQTPLHVFVDEATKLMSPSVFTILRELRKVGISLTMGQQRLGDGVERSLVGTLRDNTNVKLFGRNASMGEIFKMMSWDGDVPQLRNGQFIAAWGDEEKTLLNTHAAPHLADDSNAMGAAAWQRVLKYQLATYYRPTDAGAPAPAMLPAPSINPMDEFPA